MRISTSRHRVRPSKSSLRLPLLALLLDLEGAAERLPVQQHHPLPVRRPPQVPRLELLCSAPRRPFSFHCLTHPYERGHSRAGTPTHSATSDSPSSSPAARESGSDTHSSLQRYTLWLPHATARRPARPGSGFHRAAVTGCVCRRTVRSCGMPTFSGGVVDAFVDGDAEEGVPGKS